LYGTFYTAHGFVIPNMPICYETGPCRGLNGMNFYLPVISRSWKNIAKPLSNYPPSQKAANSSWRMNAERVSAEAVLAMRRIAAFIANMISVGGCGSAGFAEAGALVPPTSVGGAPLEGVFFPKDYIRGNQKPLYSLRIFR
jgi:hypothetical protein